MEANNVQVNKEKIEKEQKERSKAAAERKAAKAVAAGKKVYQRKPSADEERKRSGVKKTGRVHVVSKRPIENE